MNINSDLCIRYINEFHIHNPNEFLENPPYFRLKIRDGNP